MTVSDTDPTPEASDWAAACTLRPDATMVLVEMGTTTDYFKPTDTNTICDMLQSHDKHQWSPDGLAWQTPPYSQSLVAALGGSEQNWPKFNHDGDSRSYVSIWGITERTQPYHTGGCCATSYDD